MTNATYPRAGDPATTSSPERLQEAAGNVADQATRTAERQASRAMDQAGDTLDRVAAAVRQTAQQLQSEQPQIAGFADTAAQRIQDGATYLREHEARQVFRDADRFARRQPAIVIAGGLALGLAIGRVLRSGAESNASYGTGSKAVGVMSDEARWGSASMPGNGHASVATTPAYASGGTGTASSMSRPATASLGTSSLGTTGSLGTPGALGTTGSPADLRSSSIDPSTTSSTTPRTTGSSEAG